MVLLLKPHHAQLVAACYPPSTALLTSAPDYKPNSQELSRLTYYASNRPSKITKLSGVLQKRVAIDVRKASAGNLRSRASLLISLNIWKALINECRRDISLLSSSLISSLDNCLAALSSDLEVSAKVATVFIAWATYSTGQLLGVDITMTRDYVSALRRFTEMSVTQVRKNDYEDRNRSRLIGIAALTGAISSEALYNSSSQFKSQVSTILPALLRNILQVDVKVLEDEAENIKNFPLAPTQETSDGRSRPVLERRAVSIHVHVDGDKGPSSNDVVNAALRALSSLLGQSNVGQIGTVLQAVLETLSSQEGWKQTEHCCWFARKAVQWIQYQYRFAMPIRLVERLAQSQDAPSPSDLHKTLAAMIKTVFTSSTPLVNLSTSDVMANLTSLVLHRVSVDTNDELLPILVECIGALGTHIYYADQIHDLACELVSRMITVESAAESGRGRVYPRSEEERAMALRCLSASLAYLIEMSSKYLRSSPLSTESAAKDGIATPKVVEDGPASAAVPNADEDPSSSQRPAHPHRTRIPPDVFQETLTVLCDEHFEVRSDYAHALSTFLRSELSPEPVELSDGGDEKVALHRRRTSLVDHTFGRVQSLTLPVIGGGGNTHRFIHALHASLFLLATSRRLGVPSTAHPSPSHSADEIESDHPLHVNVIPSTPLHNETSSGVEESNRDTSQASQSSRRRTITNRRLVRLRRLLDQTNRQQPSIPPMPETPSCATQSDYAHILSVITAVHDRIPARALLLGVPMLVALDKWCRTSCVPEKDAPQDAKPRQNAIFELLARVWLRIADIWDCSELSLMASSALDVQNSTLNDICTGHRFPQADEEVAWATPAANDAFTSGVDVDRAISLLSANHVVQSHTGLDSETLYKQLSTEWSAEDALNESIEQTPNGDSSRPDSINPVLRIAHGLMHIENLSLQSLARSNRGVGVSELRDALEGRSNMSNLGLSQKAPSVSSLGAHTLSAVSGDSGHNLSQIAKTNRLRNRAINGENPREVRDVLDKLGIGSMGGPSLFKASLSARQNGEKKVGMTPPYKS